MLILTNGLTNKADEGFLNVANSLIKRMKKAEPELVIAGYERQSELLDYYFPLNKLLLNSRFLSFVRRYPDLLYIPFPAKTFPTAMRIFLLSCFAKNRLDVLLVMKSRWNLAARILLYLSRARIIVLSKDAKQFYQHVVPKKRVRFLKTGVDTTKFLPVSIEKKDQLRSKYGMEKDRPVILHVGHLKAGRNVGELKKIDPKYQVVLVTSTLTRAEQDEKLREELKSCPNIHIYEDYFPNIEEIYQMSDLYFFPTKEEGNCIDVPLSCLEAAACNLPVFTTDYGEMAELIKKEGFYHYDQEAEKDLNQRLEEILSGPRGDSRSAVLAYDWNHAVSELLCIKDCGGKEQDGGEEK